LRLLSAKYAKYHGVKYTPASLEAAAKLSERYINDRYLPDKAIDLIDEAGALVQLENISRITNNPAAAEVNENTIATIIHRWTSIPLGQLQSAEKDRLVSLESVLRERVKGQSRAIKSVARAIRRARSGLRDVNRPVASFLFCGPTGMFKFKMKQLVKAEFISNVKNLCIITNHRCG
jgi:ATP-dependent Clp protease ATP-binding subunit ClpC